MYFNEDDIENRFPDGLLASLLGSEYEFYGVDNNCFCIGKNGTRMVLEAVENPSDGYRSYFGCFKTSSVNKIFFRESLAIVRFKEGGVSERERSWGDSTEDLRDARSHQFSGWILEDVKTGHAWLTVGTDYTDDYYPCFTFRYSPDTRMKIGDSNEQ